MRTIILILLIGVQLSSMGALEKKTDYLTPGNYKVGFRVIQTYDYSRTFGSKTTNGEQKDNNARPLQILVWYPAKGDGEGKCLTYKDYILTGFSEVDFSPLSEDQREKFIEMHKRNFLRNGADSASMSSVLNRESYAIQDLQSADEKFPLIVYAPGGNERCYENFMMAEYLASHGYIFAAIALTGEDSQLMAFETTDYELAADDIAFVIAYMREFQGVENTKLGLAGFCYGSMINTMVANRNCNIDVIVDLFGAVNIKTTRDEVDPYSYHRLKNPNLAYMQLAGSPEERDSYFFENYLYGDVYQARFDNVSHGAFTSNYVLRNHYFKEKLPSGQSISYADTVDACYKNVCRLTLEMFNAYLKKDESAIKFINNNPVDNGMSDLDYLKRKAIPIPPSPAEFVNMARSEGVAKAKQVFNEVRNRDKYWKLFKENQMIALGYQLIEKNMIDDAIDIFSMIVFDYPKSWNGYDSLGEAWFKKGNKELARKYLEKSLDLLPQNDHAKELLKQINNDN